MYAKNPDCGEFESSFLHIVFTTQFWTLENASVARFSWIGFIRAGTILEKFLNFRSRLYKSLKGKNSIFLSLEVFEIDAFVYPVPLF